MKNCLKTTVTAALALLLTLLTAMPSWAQQAAAKSPAQLFKDGTALYGKTKYVEAMKLFDEILTTAPQSAAASDAIQYKALCYQAQNRPGEAEKIYRQALEQYPQKKALWLYSLGIVLAAETKYKEAYEALNTILTEMPKDPLVLSVKYQIAATKKMQELYLPAIEAYLAVFPNIEKIRQEGLEKLSAKEISFCLQMLDLPLEKEQWDRFIASDLKGPSPLNLETLKQKSRPYHKHSPEYLAKVEKALSYQTLNDVYGEEVMKRPEGPTYENIKDYFEPAQLCSGSFQYCQLLLCGKESFQKARMALDGSRVDVGMKISRLENIIWHMPDTAVRFYVGSAEERFGNDDAKRKGALPYKGYIPIYTTEYTSEGKTYAQRVVAEGENPLAIQVAVTVPAGGKLSILVENQQGTVQVAGNTVKNDKGQILCAFQNGTAAVHPEFNHFAWVRAEAKDQPQTLYLAIPSAPAASLTAPDKDAFEKTVERVVASWDKLLQQGGQIEVPEDVVMNAWKSSLIANFAIVRANSLLYSFADGYEVVFTYEATRVNQAFSLWGHLQDSARYFYKSTALVPSLEFHRAAQVRTAYQMYRLGGIDQWTRDNAKMICSYADQLNSVRSPKNHNLLPPGVYAGDVSFPVLALDQNMAACAAIRDCANLMKQLGDTQAAEKYFKIAKEYREEVLKAIEASTDYNFKPPFVHQALYGSGGDEEKPFQHIADSTTGGYYNIVLSRVQDTGLVSPRDKIIDRINTYLEQRGGRVLGLLRLRFHHPFYMGDSMDDTYQIAYDKSLLWRDEIDRLLVTFYGKLAHGMTRDTFVGGETVQFAPVEGESGRRLYMPPNSTTSAHYLQTLRHMLLLEDDMDLDGVTDTLYIFRGTPRAWLAEGKRIAVSKMPTEFGDVDGFAEVSKDGKTVKGEFTLPSRNPAKTVLLRLRRPNGLTLKEVTVNGQPSKQFNAAKEEIDLSSYSGKVTLTAKY